MLLFLHGMHVAGKALLSGLKDAAQLGDMDGFIDLFFKLFRALHLFNDAMMGGLIRSRFRRCGGYGLMSDSLGHHFNLPGPIVDLQLHLIVLLLTTFDTILQRSFACTSIEFLDRCHVVVPLLTLELGLTQEEVVHARLQVGCSLEIRFLAVERVDLVID